MKDPTRFLERTFTVVENKLRSIRLIDTNDTTQAISIKWVDLPALRYLIGLMLDGDPERERLSPDHPDELARIIRLEHTRCAAFGMTPGVNDYAVALNAWLNGGIEPKVGA